MKAILINPFDKTLLEIEHTGNYKNIYGLIDATLFDVVDIDSNNKIFIDDEGLLKNNQEFFECNGKVIAGKGLVLGNNDGYTEQTSLTIEELSKKINWLEKYGD